MEKQAIHIIGAGLAGSEAAWQAAQMGAQVILHEMRPKRMTDAHQTEGCAELVCSNSFRSDDAATNAVGLLHEEMRRCQSLILAQGDKAAVPAGGALAVDRDIFSQNVTAALEAHPNITIDRNEVAGLPPAEWDNVIIATGPLTSPALAEAIAKESGQDALAFFDAIAPIIHTESINFDIAWYQSRYDKIGPMGDGKDYINCPMDEVQYKSFIQAMLDAPKTEFKEWEEKTPYFEGCMPIEEMARRGIDTPRFGPMKPVGLTDPNTGTHCYAVVQLRQDNALATLYNMVGFQTKMKYAAQAEVFKTIPGLEDAQFARMGGIHRNTFINAPKLLDRQFRLKSQPRLRFAGQMTGCEGYVESASVGLMVGRMAAAQYHGWDDWQTPPATTAMGALCAHITGDANADTYQPMNINFGLFVPMDVRNERGKRVKGVERKKAMSKRALDDLDQWLVDTPQLRAA